MSLSVKHLLGIKDLAKEDIQTIFSTADNFKQVLQRPIKKVPSLRDTTVANIIIATGTLARGQDTTLTRARLVST